jgi:hypothetical protein
VNTSSCNPAEAARVQELEQQLLLPAYRANAAFLNAVLADEFEEVGASGNVFGKAHVLERLPTEDGIRREMQDPQVRQVAPGVLLVTYRVVRTHGSTVTQSLRSSLWRNNAGNWQMVFHQGTAL